MVTFGIIAAVWLIGFLPAWAIVHAAKLKRYEIDPTLQEFEDSEQLKAIEEYTRKKGAKRHS
ncbi:MAG: hypothetical protein IJI14_00820 [Anaerolineaceae bacterium]|nr:hypothetical protein [Anaerolineaceae bacterium]